MKNGGLNEKITLSLIKCSILYAEIGGFNT